MRDAVYRHLSRALTQVAGGAVVGEGYLAVSRLLFDIALGKAVVRACIARATAIAWDVFVGVIVVHGSLVKRGDFGAL